MKTFDVTLPINKAVVFPPRCVVCEKPQPDGLIKLSFLGIKTTPMLEMAVDKAVFDNIDTKHYGSNTSNRIEGIPACKGCASSLKWYHRLLNFGYYTGWLPGVILLFLGVPSFISITLVISGAIAPGVLTLIFPPSFGASFWDNNANFEFKSEKTAMEFLELNSEANLKFADAKVETNAAKT